MESPEEPLISAQHRQGELEYDASDAEETASNTSKQGESNPGVFVFLLIFSAGISGLLFGCQFREDVYREGTNY